MTRVHRFDWAGPIVVCKGDEAPPPGAFAARGTPEGYIRVEGRINGCGVYEYENDAGERWGELRLPEHVGSPATLESWQIRPIPDDHPPVLIDATNIDEYRRGSTGSNIRFDGNYTWADIVIDSPELVAKVRAGKTQLSCGYTCVLVPQRGELDGVPYDYIQTEIYGNHVAVVDLARGGPMCALVFDGAARRRQTPDQKGAVMKTQPTKQKKKDAQLVTGEGDPIEIPEGKLAAIMELLAMEAEDPGEAAADEEAGEAMAEEEEPAAAAATVDSLKARIDMLEADKKRREQDFARSVDARVALVANAREIIGPEVKVDGLPDVAIQRQIILAVNPDMEDKLKGKSGDYIQAAYDMALEAHAKNTDSSDSLLRLTGRAANTDGAIDSLDALYEKRAKQRRDRLNGRAEAN